MNPLLMGSPFEVEPVKPIDPQDHCVIRLTTNCYISGGRACFSKVISRLKRKGKFNFEDITFNDDNDDLDFGHITNLMQCEDGIYYLEPDETEWDYDEYSYSNYWYAISWKLVPYVEPQ